MTTDDELRDLLKDMDEPWRPLKRHYGDVIDGYFQNGHGADKPKQPPWLLVAALSLSALTVAVCGIWGRR